MPYKDIAKQTGTIVVYGYFCMVTLGIPSSFTKQCIGRKLGRIYKNYSVLLRSFT